jgi:hypothetical protein
VSNPIRPAAVALSAEGRFPDGRWMPTERQTKYLDALRARLNLPGRMLDDHCAKRFGAPFAAIDKRQASDLIDELVGWQEAPAELRREMGQLDMPGMAAPSERPARGTGGR